MKKANKPTALGLALVEMAQDQHQIGLIDDATLEKITLRHLGDQAGRMAQPIAPAEIRAMREQANLSQAALASLLNLTVGYISQLERGAKQPKGPSLALLNIIRHKGIEAIL